jgi:hypothetical protein
LCFTFVQVYAASEFAAATVVAVMSPSAVMAAKEAIRPQMAFTFNPLLLGASRLPTTPSLPLGSREWA